MLIHGLAQFICKCPIGVLLLSGGVSLSMTLVALLNYPFPDFSDPSMGFTTRNTPISNRILAWKNLQDDTYSVSDEKHFYRAPKDALGKESNLSNGRFKRNSSEAGPENVSTSSKNPPKYCNMSPNSHFAQLVFEVNSHEPMESIIAMCQVEQRLWNQKLLSGKYCTKYETAQSKSKRGRKCCQPWHMGSVLAHLHGLNGCQDLVKACKLRDLNLLWSPVLRCIKNQTGEFDFTPLNGKSTISVKCSDSFDIEYLIDYLLSKGFFDAHSKSYTLLILPIAKSTDSLHESGFSDDVIESLPSLLSVTGAQLIAIDFGMREYFFQKYLVQDMYFGGLAAGLVFLCMWLYTACFMFTVAAILGIALSAGVSYFVYRVVLGVQFFPFMNLMTFVLLIGVGADDAFILRKAWLDAKAEKNTGTLTRVLSMAMDHAAVSMMVTSLTTAAAFWTNLLSDIIVIKCFGLFAGVSIICNYMMVITWLPAVIIILDKYDPQHCYERIRSVLALRKNSTSLTDAIRPNTAIDAGNTYKNCLGFCNLLKLSVTSPFQKLYLICADYCRIIFEKLLPWLIIKLKLFWIFFFVSLTILSMVSVLYKPGLKLPTEDFYPYLKPDHPFERFESESRHKFLFLQRSSMSKHPISMSFVFGIQVTDDSSSWDPDHSGSLKPWPKSESNKLMDNLSLLWFRDFCHNIARQNFTQLNPGQVPMFMHCFVGYFMEYMKDRPCDITEENNRHCCKDNAFPYSPGTAEHCIGEMMDMNTMLVSQMDYLMHGEGPTGPLFLSPESNTNATKLGAIVITFFSKRNFTLSYTAMAEFYDRVNGWTQSQLEGGPEAIRNGWFISPYLQMYDLQNALLVGTKKSVLVAMALAYVILLLCCNNLLTALLAVVTISGIIFSTIASLILMEWQLNVMESTIIILSIGLSFDFTLHIAMAYHQSDEIDREGRVMFALSRVCSPIFMSAITTILAGAAMLPASTLGFFQIGAFLMLVMSISWLFSMLMMPSLLVFCGPQSDFCMPSWFIRKLKFEKRQMHSISNARRQSWWSDCPAPRHTRSWMHSQGDESLACIPQNPPHERSKSLPAATVHLSRSRSFSEALLLDSPIVHTKAKRTFSSAEKNQIHLLPQTTTVSTIHRTSLKDKALESFRKKFTENNNSAFKLEKQKSADYEAQDVEIN